MNKQELIDHVATLSGETKKSVGAVIDALTETITDALKAGAEVPIPGIGKLRVARRAERVGRNPRTGVAAVIPASNGVKFKASSVLTGAIN